ncbi:MAG: ABC transporter permease [Acidobacteriota bacterium]
MDAFFQDVRFSVRALLKRPGFTAVAVLTLALGIGATTAIFSVVNGVLLRRLPYRDEARVVTLWQTNLKSGVEREETSPANFLDWRERMNACEAIAAAEPFGHSLIDRGEPEAFRSWVVSAGFFDILGMPALYGRTFLPEEYQPGQAQVVVLGYGLWQRRFGGDPDLVGQKLVLNGQPHMVVGIMPPEFQYPPDREVWAPRPPRESDARIRGGSYIRVVGRLKPEITVEQAQAEAQAVGAQLAQEYPQTNGNVGATAVPLRESLVGQVRPALLILFGAVSFVLLIACANVANLLLARSTERSREFAIRAALGAGRGRLLRQLLAESVVLALAGGAGGVLLSGWLIDLIAAFSPGNLPRLNQVSLNGSVLVFAFGVSVLTALIFGLAPALESSRTDLLSTLKEEGRGVTGGRGRRRFRYVLVVSEVALALVLLAGAGLLVRSFVALLRVDPGFVTDRALTLEVQLGRNRMPEQRVAFVEQTIERLTSLAGVQSVGAASALPFHDNQVTLPVTIRVEGRPASPSGQDPTAYLIDITPDYLRALGVPLLRGRGLNQFDKQDAAPVVLVNQAMALRHWPAEDPLGKKITFQSLGRTLTSEIVGVTGDVRPNGFDSEPRPEVFVPYAQLPAGGMTYVVRTVDDPGTLLPAVKEKIREVNRNQTFSSIATIEQLVDRSLSQRRFNLLLLGSFAVLALVLAGIGIYGLLSFTTAQRTHEIGVRMALGAKPAQILSMVIGEGLKMVAVGLGCGVVAAVGLTRFLESLLYNVSGTDPLTFAGVSVLLVGVALLACYLPARRATKVDPMIALRYE